MIRKFFPVTVRHTVLCTATKKGCACPDHFQSNPSCMGGRQINQAFRYAYEPHPRGTSNPGPTIDIPADCKRIYMDARISVFYCTCRNIPLLPLKRDQHFESSFTSLCSRNKFFGLYRIGACVDTTGAFWVALSVAELIVRRLLRRTNCR